MCACSLRCTDHQVMRIINDGPLRGFAVEQVSGGDAQMHSVAEEALLQHKLHHLNPKTAGLMSSDAMNVIVMEPSAEDHKHVEGNESSELNTVLKGVQATLGAVGALAKRMDQLSGDVNAIKQSMHGFSTSSPQPLQRHQSLPRRRQRLPQGSTQRPTEDTPSLVA